MTILAVSAHADEPGFFLCGGNAFTITAVSVQAHLLPQRSAAAVEQTLVMLVLRLQAMRFPSTEAAAIHFGVTPVTRGVQNRFILRVIGPSGGGEGGGSGEGRGGGPLQNAHRHRGSPAARSQKIHQRS